MRNIINYPHNAESALSAANEWVKWIKEIPFVPMPRGWSVQPLPPITMAVARFKIRKPNGAIYSVYFDAYARLGCVDEPYWEVYPIAENNERFMMGQEKEMIEAIKKDKGLGIGS